jgi:hypothetical protein
MHIDPGIPCKRRETTRQLGGMPMVEAPPGYEPAKPPLFLGGSQSDQDQLLRLYYEFRVINDALDGQALRTIWSADPENVFFNSNGHTFYGLDDWLKIWNYYRPRMKALKPGGSGHIRILVRDGMGVIIDDHSGHARVRQWTGSNATPTIVANACSRVTLVCVREDAQWKVVHAHFSMSLHEQRPDQGSKE